MAYVRRATSFDATWARAWTADALVDLTALQTAGLPKHGDVAFVTATGRWYVWMDDGTWLVLGGPPTLKCAVTMSADQTVASSTTTPLTWNTETYDVGPLHDPVTNNSRFTVPVGGAGTYFLAVWIYTNSTSTAQHILSIRKNGTTALLQNLVGSVGSGAVQPFAALAFAAADGDYFEVIFTQFTGGNVVVDHSVSAASFTRIGD